MRAAFIFAALALWFFDLWPFYSGHFRPLLMQHDYNVEFYYPDYRSEALGVATGVAACQNLAKNFAEDQHVGESWQYYCCPRERDGNCHHKEAEGTPPTKKASS